ncbi:hypothetical protein ACHAQA_009657 [Verticillium albo-atrum]
MANISVWGFCSVAAVAGLLIFVSTSIITVIKNTLDIAANATMPTTTETETDEFGFYIFPTDQLPPKIGDPNFHYPMFQDENSYTFYDLMYDGTNKDKILRGLLVGCLLGIVLAMCCCCWIPCIRGGFLTDNDYERPQPAGNRRARRAAAAAGNSNRNRQPREGPNGIELVNMAGNSRRGNQGGQAVMSGALGATQQGTTAAGGSAGTSAGSRAIARAQRNRRRNE